MSCTDEVFGKGNVKTTIRRVEDGEAPYLHLAHNEWDPAAHRSVPKVSLQPEAAIRDAAFREDLAVRLGQMIRRHRCSQRHKAG